MNNKIFTIILAICGIILVALGFFGYSLYNENKTMKYAEKTLQEQKRINAKTDEAELKRIAAERETSLEEELKACLAREKTTEDEVLSPESSLNQSAESLLISLRGTWEGGGTVDGTFVVLTLMAFDGTSGWFYTNYKGRTLSSPGTLTVQSLDNKEYNIYSGNSLFAKYTNDGKLIDSNGVIMRRVSNDVPAEPFTIKIYFSNTYSEMGEYGIKEQYVYKHMIEMREGRVSGNTTFRILSRKNNKLLKEYKCGSAQNAKTDRVREAIAIQFMGTETRSGHQAKVTVESNISSGGYQIYTHSTNSDFLMYDCTLMTF